LFANQMDGRLGFEPDDKIRHVVVWLAITKVRNRESEPGVLHERVDHHVLVDVISRLLLPLLRVWYERGGGFT
jgi:hypothetical protein